MLPVEGDTTVRQEPADDREAFVEELQPFADVGEPEAVATPLALGPTGADPEFDAPVAQHVRRRETLGGQCGVAITGADNGVPDPDTTREGGEGGDGGEGLERG